jgi:hypothetical protein
MSSQVSASAPLSHIETLAWYALWSGVVCLLLVPAAWSWSGFGWLPGWLIGVPMAVLAAARLIAWSQPQHRGFVGMRLLSNDDIFELAAVAQHRRSQAAPGRQISR